MLILTRKAGESLHLGDNIKITVFSVQGKQVKIGIDVPEDMRRYTATRYTSASRMKTGRPWRHVIMTYWR